MTKKEAKKIFDLDECVINSLDLFSNTRVPEWDVPFKQPLVVGSGNAIVTGKILFHDLDAVFADESEYMEMLDVWKVDGAVLISASGEKHAPGIAQELKRRGIRTVLLTNNPNGRARKIVNESIVFPKNVEPYTYNTSTYMGMILAKTKENPQIIWSNLKKIDKKLPKNLGKYDAYYFVLPNELEFVREMFLTKFDELFGSMLVGRAYTIEETKHSKTIIPNDKELFISLGVENKIFGNKKLHIEMSPDARYGEIMATGYYIIGKIQRVKPPYFKKNIGNYMKFTSKVFGEKIEVWQ